MERVSLRNAAVEREEEWRRKSKTNNAFKETSRFAISLSKAALLSYRTERSLLRDICFVVLGKEGGGSQRRGRKEGVREEERKKVEGSGRGREKES